MNAVDYIAERAKRGTREKFEKVLQKVSHREPFEFDTM
jgi:hypothetical protein